MSQHELTKKLQCTHGDGYRWSEIDTIIREWLSKKVGEIIEYDSTYKVSFFSLNHILGLTKDQSPQEEKVYGNYPMTYPDIKLHQYVCLCIKEDNRTHLDSKCEIHGKKTEGEKMEDKVWCEHIMIGSIGNRDVYRFKTQPHGSTEMVPEKAMFCQYCSKPRPSEKCEHDRGDWWQMNFGEKGYAKYPKKYDGKDSYPTCPFCPSEKCVCKTLKPGEMVEVIMAKPNPICNKCGDPVSPSEEDELVEEFLKDFREKTRIELSVDEAKAAIEFFKKRVVYQHESGWLKMSDDPIEEWKVKEE